MNDKQKLKYYRFLRDCFYSCRNTILISLKINNSILAFLEELRFWNDLAMTIKDYDSKESYSLLLWVSDALKTNFPDHYVE